MAPDDDDEEDLYDDEFDFVDDEDDDLSDLDDERDEEDSDQDSELDRAADRDDADDSELDEQPARRPAPAKRGRGGQARAADDQRDLFERDAADRDASDRDDADRDSQRDEAVATEEEPEEFTPPPPPTNFRVHIYEYEQFKRTIDRPFTAEDAEAFASEFNRTSKPYGRFAVAGKEDASPRKTLD